MRTGVTVGALALAAAMLGPAVLHSTAHAHAIVAPTRTDGGSTGGTGAAGGAAATRTAPTTGPAAATGMLSATRSTVTAARTDVSTAGSGTGTARGGAGTTRSGAGTTRSGTAGSRGTDGEAGSATARGRGTGATGERIPTPTPVPTPTPQPDPLVQGTVVNTVAYGPHPRQRMDVWYQPDEIKRPAVFLIHGGWWSSGDKKYMTEISRSYAEQGYVVFNINYRLSGDASWPAQRTDTFDAVATARRHAALWSFDPNKYVIIGFSAGGHLATAAGTYKSGLRGLRGVVGISPVVSPLTAYTEGADTFDANKRRLRQAAIKLAGGCEPTGRCAKVWASMEVPWHASRGDAPMLVVHSEDEFVSPEHGEQLKEHLRRFGVPVTVATEPGIEHSAPLYRLPGVAERTQQWVAQKLLPSGS
ncbi:alpha/beta hydrolase [Streptosporangium sp. NPDC023615]|uniref:alpha/beta hydrolase n=1 Tax=Streptosporangium sp. NPDC023615 TaxID=3154794 RepID=UPI003447C526